jgi:hypothetical protein
VRSLDQRIGGESSPWQALDEHSSVFFKSLGAARLAPEVISSSTTRSRPTQGDPIRMMADISELSGAAESGSCAASPDPELAKSTAQ